MPKRKGPTSNQPAPLRWEFDPDIPTYDFFESGTLDEMWNLQEGVDDWSFSLGLIGRNV